jgi:hypothetical protein
MHREIDLWPPAKVAWNVGQDFISLVGLALNLPPG